MTYASFLAQLTDLRLRGMRPGLEPTRAALARLGDPQRALRIVHIAGTNGKGSTAALIEAALRESGLVTGLYTSPHLSRFTERVRVGGAEIAQDDVARLGEEVRRASPDLTFFELATCIAFAHFRECGVEVAVVETGLGGRLDATSVVKAEVCVLTRIGLDHAEILGGDLRGIAREKAAILALGATWLSAPQERAVREALPQGIRYVEDLWPGPLALAGSHQRENAALAAVAARRMGARAEAIARGFAKVSWPGRMERIGPFLLDCAHNPQAAGALATALDASAIVVFGCLSDKDAVGLVGALAKRAHARVRVRPRSGLEGARGLGHRLRLAPERHRVGAAGGSLSLRGRPGEAIGSEAP
ncbi:MAG: Mur ligase family protein, partial [Myxococcota bacterium]